MEKKNQSKKEERVRGNEKNISGKSNYNDMSNVRKLICRKHTSTMNEVA